MAALLVLASCYDPSVKLGVPCSDTGDCPSGQQCDLFSQTCLLPTDLLSWRDDTAVDFAQPGAILQDAIVEGNGAIGPVPYVTGRVRLSAIGSARVTTTNTTWGAASGGQMTGRAFSNQLSIDYGTTVPMALGLASGDDVTVLVEGEINLDTVGVWGFRLNANDIGFVEIAVPGGDFTRLVSDMSDSGTTNTIMVTTPGWHRIRAAFSDSTMVMSFDLDVDSPGAGGFRSIALDQIRAPVDDLAGYTVDVFEDGGMIDYVTTALEVGALDRQLPTDAFGVPIGMFGWSFRWSGQILIETEGDYAFEITSFHGHRMWIDGTEVANNFNASGMVTSTTPSLTLAAGWHDFVADVSKEADSTPGQMRVVIASGPVGVGQPIAVDHTRPVVGRGMRFAETTSSAVVAIPDGGSVPRNLNLALIPSAFVPMHIEAGYGLQHTARGQVSVTVAGAGAPVTLLGAGTLSGSGFYGAHATVPLDQYSTSWSFTAADNLLDTTGTGDLELAAITVIGSGGIAPFATSYRYESAVKELGNVVGFGAVTWKLRRTTSATVQMRTCDDAAGCAAEPWTDVALAAVPAVTPRRFAQYAVTMATDGDVATALDWIELQYSTD